jgi:hypothetical protein
MPPTEADAVFPALSEHVPFAVRLFPSDVTVSETESDAGSERASAQFQVTVTSDLFQPAPFGAGAFDANAMVGAVPSYLKPFEPVPTLPAPSVQLNETEADASSGVLYDVSGSQLPAPLGPLFEAAAEKLTEWLYQPFESAPRSGDTVTVGAPSSYWKLAEPVPLLPAPSVQLSDTDADASSGPL